MHDSSDDSIILGNEYQAEVIKIPQEEPTVGSWIGIKVEQISKSQKGRTLKPYEIHLGQVSALITLKKKLA